MAKNLEFDGYSERVKQIKSMRSSAEWGFMVPEACRYQLSKADYRVQRLPIPNPVNEIESDSGFKNSAMKRAT
jgi:hypothetical protein